MNMNINAEYIRKNDWPEKYLLGHLDTEQIKAYEKYLENDPQAREELEQERRMIEGIRTAGSHDMKREIQRQVASLRNPKTDWTFIYKAAAVLFVLVLVPSVIYYQNFTSSPAQAEKEQLLRHRDAPSPDFTEETRKEAPEYADDKDETIGTTVEKEKQSVQKRSDQPAVRQKKEAAQAATIKSDVSISPQQSIASGNAGAGRNSEPGISEAPPDILNEAEEYAPAELNDSQRRRASVRMEPKSLDALKNMTLSQAEPQKVVQFNENGKELKILFIDDPAVRITADSLKLQTYGSEKSIFIRLWLPRELFSASKEDVQAEISGTDITITFFKKHSFKFKSDPSEKFARKVK
ncbi:MAG: hypothetical protein KDF60_03445 [Calditrichaeota bacterium]|nr:hypothetical protein [Calditrichota bacterium]